MKSPPSPYILFFFFDIVVDGGRAAAAGVVEHMTLGGPTELLGAVEARNVAPAAQVVQLGGCEVVCLSTARGLLFLFTADDDGFWNHGQERCVHHARPAVAQSGGWAVE